MGKSHIWAWQAPEDLGHRNILSDPGEQDHKVPIAFTMPNLRLDLLYPRFPVTRSWEPTAVGTHFKRGEPKARSGSCYSEKEDLGAAFSPTPGHMGPRVLFPSCASLYPKGFSDLQTMNAQRRKHLPKTRRPDLNDRNHSERARPLGLGWPPAVLGDSGSIPRNHIHGNISPGTSAWD